MRTLRLFLAISLLIAACAPAAPAPSPSVLARYPLTVIDDRGKSVTLTGPALRVASISSAATEIVFAIGAGDRLVAVDDFSNYPAEAKALPKVGGFRTSPERILSYRPDLILAIASGDLAEQLEAKGQPVVVFNPDDLEGVYKNITLVGRLLERDASATDLIARMRSRIGVVAERAKAATTRPRVLHEVSASAPGQLFVAGPRNFIDAIITIVGGQNVASSGTVKFPKYSSEEIVRVDPEIIVLSDAQSGGVTPASVAARPGYAVISAVRSGRIYPVDEDIVSRSGPRLVDAVEVYAKLVHPEIFGAP